MEWSAFAKQDKVEFQFANEGRCLGHRVVVGHENRFVAVCLALTRMLILIRGSLSRCARAGVSAAGMARVPGVSRRGIMMPAEAAAKGIRDEESQKGSCETTFHFDVGRIRPVVSPSTDGMVSGGGIALLCYLCCHDLLRKRREARA